MKQAVVTLSMDMQRKDETRGRLRLAWKLTLFLRNARYHFLHSLREMNAGGECAGETGIAGGTAN